MSLKPIPGVGKSGTSRIFDFRSTRWLAARDPAQVAPEEQLRELLRERSEGLEILHPGSCGARDCASGATARRAARSRSPPVPRTSGTGAACAARSRSARAWRRRRRSRRRSRRSACPFRSRSRRAGRTPRARARAPPPLRRACTAPRASARSSSDSPIGRRRLRARVGEASSCWITRSGRNSSRWRRRIVRRRSTSSSSNSR